MNAPEPDVSAAAEPVVHRPMPHDSAVLHVTGRAVFIDNMIEPVGTLHLAPGFCPDMAAGRIRDIDLSRVRQAPFQICRHGTLKAQPYIRPIHALIIVFRFPLGQTARLLSGNQPFSQLFLPRPKKKRNFAHPSANSLLTRTASTFRATIFLRRHRRTTSAHAVLP